MFAFTTIVPLMLFVWTLHRLDALSELEFQIDLGLALTISLLGFYLFRQLMGLTSDLIQIVGAAVERSVGQAAAARPPGGAPAPGSVSAPAPPGGAPELGGAATAPASEPPAAQEVLGIGPIQEVRDLGRTTALLWKAEAAAHLGHRVVLSVMNASRPIPGTLLGATDDGLLLEVAGSERITVSYKRISAIDPEQPASKS